MQRVVAEMHRIFKMFDNTMEKGSVHFGKGVFRSLQKTGLTTMLRQVYTFFEYKNSLYDQCWWYEDTLCIEAIL